MIPLCEILISCFIKLRYQLPDLVANLFPITHPPFVISNNYVRQEISAAFKGIKLTNIGGVVHGNAIYIVYHMRTHKYGRQCVGSRKRRD